MSIANQIFCWVCTGKFGGGQSDHDMSAAGETQISSTSAWTKVLKMEQSLKFEFYWFLLTEREVCRLREIKLGFVNFVIPVLTKAELLYSVPRWGPERDRKVCSLLR